MQMDLQVALVSEVHVIQESIPVQAGDPSVVCSVTKEHRVKKPTRQWAAWTREEEENFFTALRQVGKNFEKITCRVQSKNKDQVRHYYYRLVRRMNKLLGPGLYLDAKNSKDTNAAMLRWWSLLEKYSCRASKLHLKPRRFKVFVEALEHQLLKDRKKNMKKRPSQVENYSPTSPNTITSQGRASGHEVHTVKLVLVDSQNIQKLGPGKGTFKRTTSMNINKSGNKGEMGKASRQRRKPAAYRKWEKAAIDGVSLVADAAEHLERADHGKVEYSNNSGGEKGVVAVNAEPSPLLIVPVESSINSNGKLKLQLFPIDDVTRRALEVDKHNPHLELTLSTRKKISSVLEHLNRKWGDSIAASGELMLFPYAVHMENILGYQKWTQTSNLTAADVYAVIGTPSVFRLRYGWFADAHIATMTCQASLPAMCNLHVHDFSTVVRKDHGMGAEQLPLPSTYEHSEKPVNFEENQPTSRENSDDFGPPLTGSTNKMCECHGSGIQNNVDLAARALRRSEHSDGLIMAQMGNEDDKKLSEVPLSAGEWVDSLTNMSVGDLLSDVPDTANAECVDPPVRGGSQCLQQIPFNCDSFDAAIAAHISRHQSKMGILSKFESHTTSIWDAEETCDAFSFQKNRVPCSEFHAVSGPISQQTVEAEFGNLTEELRRREVPLVDSPCSDPGGDSLSDSQILDSSHKDFSALTDIYWPDSLGPLDLDLPSSKYHSADLIIGDSIGSLNGLIASSVDALQNCSFFSLEKKQPTSTTEA